MLKRIITDNELKNITPYFFTDLYVESNLIGEEYQMYLPKNTYIICDTNITQSTTENNLTKMDFGYVVKNTGYINLSGNFVLCYQGVSTLFL